MRKKFDASNEFSSMSMLRHSVINIITKICHLGRYKCLVAVKSKKMKAYAYILAQNGQIK